MKLLKIAAKAIIVLITVIVIFILTVFILDNRNTRYLKITNHPEGERNSYLIKNVNIVPMSSDTILVDKMVLIEDGVITEISSDISVGQHIVIDGKDQYLLPGLIDMHVHVWDKYELGLYLANGVTTVRNLWGQPMHLRMKELIESGEIFSPDFFTSGPKLTGSEFMGDDNFQIFSEEEARQVVIDTKERGYDFIKTYYGLPQEYFDVVIDQAKLSGLDIAAHPSNKVAYDYHFNSQIKTIEHAEDIVQQPLEYKLDSAKLEEVVKDFSKAEGTSFCPTLTVYHNIYKMIINDSILNSSDLNYMNPLIRMVDSEAQFSRWNSAKRNDSTIESSIKNQHEFHLLAIKKLHEAGVNIVCGTDAGIGVTIPGKSIHQELAFYKQAGLSNYQVLKTATINPSKTHEFLNDFGTIERGKVANLLLVDDNPIDNLATLEQPQIVFSGGRMINRATLDTFEVKAAERSNLLASAFRYIEFLLLK